MKEPKVSASVDGKVVLNEDQVMALFIENHLVKGAAYDGKMFETYGDEVAFVKAQPADRIATLVEGDSGGLYICHGWHYVNRLGYFIGKEALPDFGSLCVLEEGDEEEGEE